MKKIESFKKHQIKEINKIKGGAIPTSIDNDEVTDYWYLLTKNNPTGDGHVDVIYHP